jgi:hypothetical protein
METKPYNLQSPEQIAKDYGGDKQKIAQAMQMGIIDPTAGTLAGMFIDKMRSAAQQEQAPQQTVAQQVFAPPAPQPMPQQAPAGVPPMAPPGAPAGLGATPEAAAMGMAPPSMGAPSMGAIPGMAEGGMVGPYDGGLSDLPVPDGMFDEPSNGGYAGGGLIAFAGGTDEDGVQVAQPSENVDNEDIVVEGRPDTSPESYYGFFKNPEFMREQIDALYKPERKYSNKLTEMYEGIMSPEAQKKRKQEDLWMALGQIGARMATTPGSLLQAASTGIGAALPGIQAASKERRAEQRDAIKTLASNEGLNNKESLDLAKLTMEGTDKYGQFDMKRLDREQQERLKLYEERMANWRTSQQVGAQIKSAQIGASAQSAYMDKQLTMLQRQVAATAVGQLPELRAAKNNPIGLAHNTYQMTLQQYGPNSPKTLDAYAKTQQVEDAYVQSQVQRASGGMSATGGNYGAPPEGAVQRVR